MADKYLKQKAHKQTLALCLMLPALLANTESLASEHLNGTNTEIEALSTELPSGYVNPNPLPDNTVHPVTKAAADKASHFLSQASLGANYATVTQVATIGESQWLESQFTQPIGHITPYTQFLYQKGGQDEAQDHIGPYRTYDLHAWMTQVMTSPDLVRQRVAMALSEIFVISKNVEAITAFHSAGFYDILLSHSFGNFRELLKAITLSPAMGVYLSHMDNAKANETTGTFPDENFAREIMQLFSIGLFELNPDGSRKKDQNGKDIPTYGQSQIREFAKVFTGLSIKNPQGFGYGKLLEDQVELFLKPMVMYDAHHSPGAKHLLNGTVIPQGQTGMQDLDAAIDNLFNHPNVGPFIGKLLIQRMVTSNPSPAYVARVTAAFDGGNGKPRGDMKNLLRAILFDPEARTAPLSSKSTAGRLREPFLRLIRLMRTFNSMTSDRNFSANGTDVMLKIRQFVMHSPSVFNFYLPGYAPNDDIKKNNLVAPEFQITTAATIIEIKNLIDVLLSTNRMEEAVGQLPAEKFNFSAEVVLAKSPDKLIDRLDTLLTYGTLSNHTRLAIKETLEQISSPLEKVIAAIYLIAVSPDFAVTI